MTHKTLAEIVELAKDNHRAELSYDDLFYGLLVLSYLHAFDSHDMLEIAGNSPAKLQFVRDESFRRNKTALNKPPREYLGDTWDPASSHYQLQRASMKRLLDKIITEKVQEQTQMCPACNGKKTLLQLFDSAEVECPVCRGKGSLSE